MKNMRRAMALPALPTDHLQHVRATLTTRVSCVDAAAERLLARRGMENLPLKAVSRSSGRRCVSTVMHAVAHMARNL